MRSPLSGVESIQFASWLNSTRVDGLGQPTPRRFEASFDDLAADCSQLSTRPVDFFISIGVDAFKRHVHVVHVIPIIHHPTRLIAGPICKLHLTTAKWKWPQRSAALPFRLTKYSSARKQAPSDPCGWHQTPANCSAIRTNWRQSPNNPRPNRNHIEAGFNSKPLFTDLQTTCKQSPSVIQTKWPASMKYQKPSSTNKSNPTKHRLQQPFSPTKSSIFILGLCFCYSCFEIAAKFNRRRFKKKKKTKTKMKNERGNKRGNNIRSKPVDWINIAAHRNFKLHLKEQSKRLQTLQNNKISLIRLWIEGEPVPISVLRFLKNS